MMKFVAVGKYALRLLVLSAFFGIFMMPPIAGAAEKGPAETIKTFNAALLEAMKKADELGYEGRYRLLDPVIRDSFALPYMLRQATGRHWKTLTEDQKKELFEVYTDWTVATYAARFDGYSGQRFEVAGKSSTAKGTVGVVSRLIKADNEEIDFDYQLQKREGSWRIVDILIKGVSQLAMTRAQFTGILEEHGYNDLIASLRVKIKTFSEKKKH